MVYINPEGDKSRVVRVLLLWFLYIAGIFLPVKWLFTSGDEIC